MQFLEEQEFSVGRVQYSKVGWWFSMKKGGRPGAWIILVLM